MSNEDYQGDVPEGYMTSDWSEVPLTPAELSEADRIKVHDEAEALAKNSEHVVGLALH